MGQHPNSLANLRPWRRGQSGNPNGRCPGVVYVSEFISSMLAVADNGTPACTKADLEKVVEDDSEPPAKVIAARRVLSAMRTGDRWVQDRDGQLFPTSDNAEPGRDFDRICDRTEGKPTQRVQVEHKPAATPEEARGRMLEIFKRQPGVLEDLRRMIAEHDRLQLIDTTATPTS